MKKPIQYYYYYYGGSFDKWDYNEYDDLKVIIDFLSEVNDSIEKLLLNPSSNEMINKLLINEKNESSLNGWVLDVKNQVYTEIRDLKNISSNKESLHEKWIAFDKLGLTSIQLKSKITIWNNLFKVIREFIKEKFKSFSKYKKEILKALSATNIILKSISLALPGIETIIELKDFYELSLED